MLLQNHPRILLARHSLDTGWMLRWSSMTSLLPTRWILILSAKLIHLQVDAEVHLARDAERDQESEEAETEVFPLSTIFSPHAGNKKTIDIYFYLLFCQFGHYVPLAFVSTQHI